MTSIDSTFDVQAFELHLTQLTKGVPPAVALAARNAAIEALTLADKAALMKHRKHKFDALITAMGVNPSVAECSTPSD